MTYWVRGRTGRHVKVIVAILAIVTLFYFHAAILHGIGSLLVSTEPMRPVQFVIILGDPGWVEHTADLIDRAAVRTVVLVEPKMPRTVAVGAVESFATLGRKELLRQGVSEDAIEVVLSQAENHHQAFRAVNDWLQQKPDTQSVILVNRLRTRYFRQVIDSVLAADHAKRLHVVPIRLSLYDETNWWHSADGLKGVARNYLSLIHVLCYGEPDLGMEDWDPDQYQRSLQ